MFTYSRNKIKHLFGKITNPTIYNGSIWSIQDKKTQEEFYFLVKHSYLNMHRKEPLSFVGVKVHQDACPSEVLGKFSDIKKELVNVMDYNFSFCYKEDMDMPALKELISLKKSAAGATV